MKAIINTTDGKSFVGIITELEKSFTRVLWIIITTKKGTVHINTDHIISIVYTK